MPHAIRIRQTGAPEVPNWAAIDVGEPGSGQVRMRQAAAGLNYIDVYPLLLIPGLEGAGTVDAGAADVRGLKVGDRVVRLPDAISFDQAAAVMLQGHWKLTQPPAPPF
jgi:NADPH2:quinone reductase